MSMKRTQMEKLKAKQAEGRMHREVAPGRLAPAGADAPGRREQRDRERALGLIPFAVKLNADLVKEVRVLAESRQVDLNELVAALLREGLKG